MKLFMSQTLPFIALLGGFFIAGCGGSGGYGGSPSSSIISGSNNGSTASSTSSSSTTTSSSVTPWGHGTPGSVQLATAGGPTFAGSSNQANVAFVAVSRNLEAGANIRAGDDTTVTVIANSPHGSSVRLAIPSLGIDDYFNTNTDLRGFAGDTPYWGLNYVALGEWAHWNGTPRTTSYTATVFGYETPASAIPTTGSAEFRGYASGVVFKGSDPGTYLSGFANVSADFTSGKVTGAFTLKIGGSSQPWNDVSVSASILSGTNKFSGTTAVTSVPNNNLSLSGAASGRIDGGFYGPGADELGAVWTLSDSSGSAVGGLAGRR